MHRRDFLRYMAALGLVSGAGRLVLPEEVWAMAPQETPQPFVAKAQGSQLRPTWWEIPFRPWAA